jgi:hypothetical protein
MLFPCYYIANLVFYGSKMLSHLIDIGYSSFSFMRLIIMSIAEPIPTDIQTTLGYHHPIILQISVLQSSQMSRCITWIGSKFFSLCCQPYCLPPTQLPLTFRLLYVIPLLLYR